MEKKIFLGGTCNGSKWRERLIPNLTIDYFNPVVENWTEECKQEEIKQREECDYILYCITPLMKGVYSIAEAVEDSIKRPEKTIFAVLSIDVVEKEGGDIDYCKYDDVQLSSLVAVGEMVARNGGKFATSLIEVAMLVGQ